MAQAETEPDDVAQDLVAGILAAVDQAFIEAVFARYGGGIRSVVIHGSRSDEQLLRATPGGASGHLLLEVHLTEGSGARPAGFSQLPQRLSTVVGTVTMAPSPGGRAMRIEVLSEVFDDQDGASRLSDDTLATGVLLQEAAAFLPGGMGAGRIDVVRGRAGQRGMAQSGRQSQRGWLPRPVRTRGDRQAGLGGNGRVTAPPSSLPMPVAAILLRRIAERLIQADGIGDKLERVVVGLEDGNAN